MSDERRSEPLVVRLTPTERQGIRDLAARREAGEGATVRWLMKLAGRDLGLSWAQRATRDLQAGASHQDYVTR